MVYLAIAIAVDFTSRKKSSFIVLNLLKGYLFHSLVLPGSFLVFVMFWTFFSINREWVYPSVCDEVYPYWLNHASHTNIMVVVLFEMAIGNNLPPSFKIAFTILSLVTLLYDIMYVGLYFNTGKWLYSFYYLLNWPMKIGFLLFLYLFCVVAIKCSLWFTDRYRTSKTMRVKQ